MFSFLVPQLPLLNPERLTNSFHLFESFVLSLVCEWPLMHVRVTQSFRWLITMIDALRTNATPLIPNGAAKIIQTFRNKNSIGIVVIYGLFFFIANPYTEPLFSPF